jgi:hypothetical protein
MIDEREANDKINKFTKARTAEKRGITIGLGLLSGDKIIGTLLDKQPNVFTVLDFEDRIPKEIHRATIQRFMVILQGGLDDGNGTGTGTLTGTRIPNKPTPIPRRKKE